MSTVTPVILVVVNGNHMSPEQQALIEFYDSNTPMPLVLLQECSDGTRYDDIEWASIIVNSGDRDHGAFRVNAYDIISNHSNMVPIAVVEGNPRYEKQWNIPVLKHWSEL